MHRTWKIWLFAMLGALLLAACQAQVEQPQAAVVQEAAVAVSDTPAPAEAAAIIPTETEETAVEPPAAQEESSDAVASPLGQTVNDYTNVSYTQADADLIGKTNRAQFVITYATW